MNLIKAKSPLDRVEHQAEEWRDISLTPLSNLCQTQIGHICRQTVEVGGQNFKSENLVTTWHFYHFGRTDHKLGDTDVDVKLGEVKSINIVD